MSKNVLLFDMNNLAIRILFTKTISADPDNIDWQYWKYLVIDNIIKGLIRNKGINEVVLAIDDRVSWRRQYWEGYKGSRSHKKDQSRVDWHAFHTRYSLFEEEIRTHLPFKAIHVRSAEADDVIGTLCLSYPTSQFLIISTDEDYIQLLGPNVRLFNPHPAHRRYIECSNPENFVITKSLMGQKKDDIPNVKTPLDWPADKKRPPMGKKQVDIIMREGYEKWLKAKNLEKRFHMNRVMIDFKMIPNVIKTRVLDAYDKYEYPNLEKIYEFFAKNNFKSYLENYHAIERVLIKLY